MNADTPSSMLASWEAHFMANDTQPSHKSSNSWSSTNVLTDTSFYLKFSKAPSVHESSVSSSNTSLHEDAERQGGSEKDEWKPAKAEWMIIATMAVTSLITALDSTVLVPVLPTLAADLHGTAQEAFWAGTSYLLANSVFQPFLAALSDVFGRREVLLPSVLAFFIGSVICGWANNFTTLLAGRVMQGIGGGGIMTLAQLIFADMIPLRQRPKYFAIVLGAWGIGTVLGPLVGGVLVEKSTWRWCFWLNLPICGISMIMVYLFVKLELPQSSLREKLLRIDWLGAALFTSSLTSILIAISWGGVQFAWSSWHTLVPLIAGAAGLVITVIWERYGAKEPLLTKSLFRNSSAVFSYLCAMLQGAVLLTALYYLPFYFSSVLHASPLKSGVDLLAACICTLPGSAIVSALITRLGCYRIFVWIGWVLSIISVGLLTMLDQNTPTAVWAVSLCIYGVGMGMILSSVNFSVQACVEPRDAGRAAAMYAFTRNVGMSVGVAIGGSVFQNFMKRELSAQGLPQSIALGAEGFVHQLWDRQLTPEAEFLKIQAAYVHGFHGVFSVSTGMCGLALVLALFIKHFNMNRTLESKFTLQR